MNLYRKKENEEKFSRIEINKKGYIMGYALNGRYCQVSHIGTEVCRIPDGFIATIYGDEYCTEKTYKRKKK